MTDDDLRLPDMSGSEKYSIAEGESDKIKAKLFTPPKSCDWCGHSEHWRVCGTVYTDVTFDILNDHHVRTKAPILFGSLGHRF